MYYLALVALLVADTVAPRPLALYRTAESCLAAASRLNATTDALREPDALAAGVAFVCLTVVYPT